jgi:hypothetical protein
MNAEAIHVKATPAGWDFRHMTVALLVGFTLQALFLPCLCPIGNAKMTFAIVFDLLVLARTLVAYRRHETGRGWIVYAAFCYTSAGWTEGITYLVLGET